MAFAKKTDEIAVITPPKLVDVAIQIKGTSPLVINNFSAKQRKQILDDMATPKSQKKSKTHRDPRNYDDDFQQARHLSTAGWDGIPAAAFRAAMIDACRAAGIVMTKAKMSVFVIADGFDAVDGTALVRIIGGAPRRLESPVRNKNGGADIRIRPQWVEWGALVQIQFDADMISLDSVVNLMDRAGRQVGVGEGRPYSKDSVGQGWGTFVVVQNGEAS